MTNVASLVEEFTDRLAVLIESQTLERARQAVESALGVKRPGRPAAHLSFEIGGKPRRKLPVQLCPVPGCKNKAAPIFGMVCSDHKNVSKAKIKKYREARRAAKAGGSPKGGAARKTKRRATTRKTRTIAKRRAPRKSAARSKAAAKKSAAKAAPKPATAASAPASAAA